MRSLTNDKLSQLIIKVVSTESISKEVLVVITKTFRLSLINVPDNLPLNNTAVLVEHKLLAPTASVFEQLY